MRAERGEAARAYVGGARHRRRGAGAFSRRLRAGALGCAADVPRPAPDSPRTAERLGLVRGERARALRFLSRSRDAAGDRSPDAASWASAARLLDPEAKDRKYVNSPDSPLFHKKECLYGLHVALDAIRKSGTAIVVEGNFDVLALHEAGIDEAVAPMGTALTAEQIALLGRLARKVVVVFDGDAAGQRAAEKAVPLFVDGRRRRAGGAPAGGRGSRRLRPPQRRRGVRASGGRGAADAGPVHPGRGPRGHRSRPRRGAGHGRSVVDPGAQPDDARALRASALGGAAGVPRQVRRAMRAAEEGRRRQTSVTAERAAAVGVGGEGASASPPPAGRSSWNESRRSTSWSCWCWSPTIPSWPRLRRRRARPSCWWIPRCAPC